MSETVAAEAARDWENRGLLLALAMGTPEVRAAAAAELEAQDGVPA